MEKRRYERIQVDPYEMVIEEIEGLKGIYKDVTICIKDVSLMGIRFTSEIEFDINEIITFKLPSMDILSLVTGRIAWKHCLGESEFQYGMEIYSEDGNS